MLILIIYKTENEYKNHYDTNLRRVKIETADGIRIYFGEQKFWHAFYERDPKGKKDLFSFERAKYIDWIKPTLECQNATFWQGWNNDRYVYEPHRRVAIVYEGHIVVVQLGLKNDGTLKGNFITAFYDKNGHTVKKIQTAPIWKKEECIKHLTEEKV